MVLADRIEREKDCICYLMDMVEEKIEQGRFDEAWAYLENAQRSVREIERLEDEVFYYHKLTWEVVIHGKRTRISDAEGE